MPLNKKISIMSFIFFKYLEKEVLLVATDDC